MLPAEIETSGGCRMQAAEVTRSCLPYPHTSLATNALAGSRARGRPIIVVSIIHQYCLARMMGTTKERAQHDVRRHDVL